MSSGLFLATVAAADASRGRFNAESGYWVAQGRLIAFQGWYGRDFDNERLWLMNADGSNRRPLNADVISPSGSKLAWSGDTGTAGFVSAYWRNGKTIRTFTIHVTSGEGYGPIYWAPDEHALLVEVSTTDRAMLYLADLHRGLRLISRVRSRNDESAAWSPNSRQIAFVSCATDVSNCRLAVMRPDRTAPRNLRDIDHEAAYGVQPVWSPEGRTIAYALRFGPTRPSNTDPAPQQYGIYVVHPDGSGFRRIARTPYMRSLGISLAWSPDSRQIAFTDIRGVTTVRLSDGQQQHVSSMGQDTTLSWAPSARILFDSQGNLYTVLPGRRPVRIAP